MFLSFKPCIVIESTFCIIGLAIIFWQKVSTRLHWGSLLYFGFSILNALTQKTKALAKRNSHSWTRSHQAFASSQEGDALVIDLPQNLDRLMNELAQGPIHDIDIPKTINT